MVWTSRSIRARYAILLFATAIQGLTPDQSDLASPRLLRLVLSTLLDSESDCGRAPTSIPIPSGEEDGVPREFFSTLGPDATPRVRPGTHRLPCVDILAVGLLDRPASPATHSLRRPDAVACGADRLILSLCRFQC
jgi:hypothetical protein